MSHALLAALFWLGAPAIEAELLAEINELRGNPVAYARRLEEYRGWMRGQEVRAPGETPHRVVEGVTAVDEAIAVLRQARAMPPLRSFEPLRLQAEGHARDQGFTGNVGHSANGLRPMMKRYGWKGWAQNLTYGRAGARLTILELLIDDGVADRGHRRNLLNRSFTQVGIACAPHRVYGRMCVMNFAAP